MTLIAGIDQLSVAKDHQLGGGRADINADGGETAVRVGIGGGIHGLPEGEGGMLICHMYMLLIGFVRVSNEIKYSIAQNHELRVNFRRIVTVYTTIFS